MSHMIEIDAALTVDGMNITRLSGRPRTPGNVGLALSGGGSRAAACAMGATRALHHFGLLGHLRAISCVSGGSWFGIPFTFLPARFDDDVFLGRWVEDPGALRWEEGPAATDLCTLERGNFGVPLTQFEMSTAHIVADVARDARAGIHPSRLWSREIGEGLLSAFELAQFDATLPLDTFAADAIMARSIAMQSAELPAPYLVRGDATVRPYLIVGGAMRVHGHDGADTLAPVQFTPYFSGVFGSQIGTLGDREVGGGGISSYAFGSQWLAGSRARPQCEVRVPLALSDVAGISSAAYADMLSDKSFHDLSPSLVYFSPLWHPPAGIHGVFADGGSLENTGVANLLAYDDIDAVIALVSPPKGIEREDGDVVVERQIGALFGYREYEDGVGYRRYDEPGIGNPDYGHNQVFDHENGHFQALVRTMGQLDAAGEPTVVEQRLTTVDNPRFAVIGGREIRVIWCYVSRSERWEDLLDRRVRLHVHRPFPNLPTGLTMLGDGQIALLAHYCAWSLGQHRDALVRMFFPEV